MGGRGPGSAIGGDVRALAPPLRAREARASTPRSASMYRELLAIRREEPALRPGAARITVREQQRGALDRNAARRTRRTKPARAVQSLRVPRRVIPLRHDSGEDGNGNTVRHEAARHRSHEAGAGVPFVQPAAGVGGALLPSTLTDMRVWPGQPYPLGATWDGEGVNFAIFSENATGVALCLFDAHGRCEGARAHPDRRAQRSGLALLSARRAPGTALRLSRHGPYSPRRGTPLQPESAPARSRTRRRSAARSSGAMRSSRIRSAATREDLEMNHADSARGMPKCVVVDNAFTWGNDAPPRTPWNRTVIYEAHAKGMTIRHPDIPEEIRGTYLALSSRCRDRSSSSRSASPRSSCSPCITSSSTASSPRRD